MKDVRELLVHLVLLAVAALLGFVVWTTDEDTTQADAGLLAEVWPGKVEDLQRVEWDGKSKLRLEAHRDANGAWYVGTVVKNQVMLKPEAATAKASKSSASKPEEKTVRFLSVDSAKPLVEALAPLKAYRALGNYDESRQAEFGFDEPEGTLHVTFGSGQRSLVVGGKTPGGGDHYARDADTNVLYAVSGDIVNNLTRADQRLFERELHGFEMADIDTLQVGVEDKTRALTRIAGKSESWADAGSPTSADETAGNWVGKLSRLAPSEYVEQPPRGLESDSVVVRVQYLEGRRRRGFVELFRVPGTDGTDYFVRTEQTRSWYAKVLRSTAEQIEQDVASVVRQ